MAEVVYFARDMLFTSKIREVARQLGLTVAGVREPAGLAEAATGARVLIVDLRLEGALEALDLCKQTPALAGLSTIGFVDHERADIMDAARAHGCGQVLTKGQFSHALPRLLAPV